MSSLTENTEPTIATTDIPNSQTKDPTDNDVQFTLSVLPLSHTNELSSNASSSTIVTATPDISNKAPQDPELDEEITVPIQPNVDTETHPLGIGVLPAEQLPELLFVSSSIKRTETREYGTTVSDILSNVLNAHRQTAIPSIAGPFIEKLSRVTRYPSESGSLFDHRTRVTVSFHPDRNFNPFVRPDDHRLTEDALAAIWQHLNPDVEPPSDMVYDPAFFTWNNVCVMQDVMVKYIEAVEGGMNTDDTVDDADLLAFKYYCVLLLFIPYLRSQRIERMDQYSTYRYLGAFLNTANTIAGKQGTVTGYEDRIVQVLDRVTQLNSIGMPLLQTERFPNIEEGASTDYTPDALAVYGWFRCFLSNMKPGFDATTLAMRALTKLVFKVAPTMPIPYSLPVDGLIAGTVDFALLVWLTIMTTWFSSWFNMQDGTGE